MFKKLNVLLVEDDDVAAESVIRSLRKVSEHINVVLAENGKIALDILRSDDDKSQIASPFLVLLDLNMPVMSGFEFLEHVRSDEKLNGVVIFILTTSNDDKDKARAYDNHVAGYMVKSSVGPQFSKLATLLDAYRDAIETNNI